MAESNLFMASTPRVPEVDLGMNDAVLTRIETTYITGGQFGEGHVIEVDGPNGPEKRNRFRWVFSLTDAEGNFLIDEETGNPIRVDTLSGLLFYPKAKNQSKQTRIMKALLTPAETAMWVEGEGAPPESSLIGRPVQVDVQLRDGYLDCAAVVAARKRR